MIEHEEAQLKKHLDKIMEISSEANLCLNNLSILHTLAYDTNNAAKYCALKAGFEVFLDNVKKIRSAIDFTAQEIINMGVNNK